MLADACVGGDCEGNGEDGEEEVSDALGVAGTGGHRARSAPPPPAGGARPFSLEIGGMSRQRDCAEYRRPYL